MEDDEIHIDFSKVKGWFKKKEPKKEEAVQQAPTVDKHDTSHSHHTAHHDTQSKAAHETSHRHAHSPEKKDDEISLDFSKVKGWFKGKSSPDFTPKSEDEISFDFGKVKGFFSSLFSSSSSKYLTLILILIPFLFTIYLRSMPAGIPITDEWAKGAVYDNLKQQIVQQAQGQYPNLPQANLDSIINQNIAQIEKQNKAQIDDQIKQVSAYFKTNLQKPDGHVYLGDIDPYYWVRHADNILKNGHPGDELRNKATGEVCMRKGGDCVPWDTHMYAPLGREVPKDMLYPYFLAYFHKFLSIFDSGKDLMNTSFLIPILIGSLSVIPAFFIGRRLSNNFGGFIAALFMAVHPAYLGRTMNSADNDTFSILIPLAITWMFLEFMESKDIKKGLIWSAFAGILTGLYTRFWGGGWWYIFDFLLAAGGLSLVISIIANRDRIKEYLPELKGVVYSFAIFFIVSMVSISLISGFSVFMDSFIGPFGFIQLKQVGITVWPNVFTTVAEQNPASLSGVISQIANNSFLLFMLSLLGVALTALKKEDLDVKDWIYFGISAVYYIIILASKSENLFTFLVLIALPVLGKVAYDSFMKRHLDYRTALILLIWYMSTMYASTKGVRYLLLLVPVFSISYGVAIGFLFENLTKLISKGMYLNKTLTNIVIGILLIFIMINPIKSAYSIAYQSVPLMNDAWYDSLEKIKYESAPDAIINSWWDYGHWFKYIGDRAVTFDGTSQNSPMAHWIGYALLTNNEDEAMGILRMLDCGSNTAFDILNREVNDIPKSAGMLHEVVKMDKEQARAYLRQYVDADTAEQTLAYTHCDAPDDYFITSDDMIGKSGVWAHFGIWNFDRSLMYSTLKLPEYQNNAAKSTEFLKTRFNMSDEEADSMYSEIKSVRTNDAANSWIAPWPSYASGLIGCSAENTTIVCPIQAQGVTGSVYMNINLKDKTADILTPQGTLHPNAIAYPTEDGIEKFTYSNSTIGLSATMVPNGNGWSYILMAPPLEDSMYTRMYFQDGHGLHNFQKISDMRSITGNRIVVWKVDWNKKQENLVYFRNESI